MFLTTGRGTVRVETSSRNRLTPRQVMAQSRK